MWAVGLGGGGGTFLIAKHLSDIPLSLTLITSKSQNLVKCKMSMAVILN